MADFEQTQVVTRAQAIDLMGGARLHCLELEFGDETERRHVVTPLGLKFGRTAPADVVLADSDVSRAHCMVLLRDDDVLVSDLGSTNGTFIDGVRITEVTELPLGSVLQVGNKSFRHECMSRTELDEANELDREAQKAASHVRTLLPEPIAEGPVRTDWVYRPSARLGGDAFGYVPLGPTRLAFYLVDVASHGPGAALHAAAAINRLQHKSLPGIDMARPDQVLGALNDMFQMEEHAGLYFTVWYGVYDSATRRLDFASGGHHGAYLVPPEREVATPLRTRNVVIGAMPAMEFSAGSIAVPAGANIYLFSDGVFEIVDRHGAQWTIEDFVALMLKPREEGVKELQRLSKAVTKAAHHGALDDDFSLLVLEID